jgi:hypothetical protein
MALLTLAFGWVQGQNDCSPSKHWEVIADRLSAAGITWGYCSSATCNVWRWVVDAYRGDGQRYIVESDELLSAFLELEATLLPRSGGAKL